MVQTRRQYQDWVERRGPDYATSQSSQECEECSQESNISFSYESNAPRGPNYSQRDQCHRHRPHDDEPYGQLVQIS